MNRPDLRNYSYKDLCAIKNFEALSHDEQDWKINNECTVSFMSLLGVFGYTFEKVGTQPNGQPLYTVVEEPWHEPIAESPEELLKLGLPKVSCDYNGHFPKREDKWREGKFDIGHEPDPYLESLY